MKNPLHGLRFRRDHHWTPGKLSAYLDDDLVARSPARVQRHVRDCPDCRHALHSLERLLGRLRGLPSVSDTETPDIASAVRRRLCDPSTH